MEKIVDIAAGMRGEEAASLTSLQTFDGKLSFARTGAAGRFGRAALKPCYKLIAKDGGGLSPKR